MRTFILFLCLLSLGCQETQPNDLVVKKLNQYIEWQMQDKNLPAFAISIVEGDHIRYAGGFGDMGEGKQPDGETVFRVASVSKLFNAVAIMQEVEAGQLDLDEPISTYLPEFNPTNPFDKSITIRQILSHKSGLVRESPIGSYFDPDEPTLAEMVASLNSTELVYEPETRTKYSNAAVSVSGYVLEHLLGRPYAEILQENVLDPIGMESSSFAPRVDLTARLSDGFMWTYTGRRFLAPVFEMGIQPAAGLYTTMTDLSRFSSMIFNAGQGEKGKVLNPETLDLMFTPQFTENDSGFGLGFYVSSYAGRRRIVHGGVMYGYATRFSVMPDEKIGVSAVSTLDASNATVDRIVNYAYTLLLAESAGEPLPDFETSSAIDPEVASDMVGHFSNGDFAYVLSYEESNENSLMLFNGVEKHRVRKVGDHFETDDPLAYGFSFDFRNHAMITESDSFAFQPYHTPAEISAENRELVGEYGWDHNTLFISEENGQLFALIEWFFQYRLTKVEKDVYAFPDYGLYQGEHVIFERDSSGEITIARAAEVPFAIRPQSVKFRITPQHDLKKLRQLSATSVPPFEEDKLESDLVNLAALSASLKLDIRYATDDNFLGTQVYDAAKAFLQHPAGEALLMAREELRKNGVDLIVYDAYRPWSVTWMFWEATPDSLRNFVANPQFGSRHNRGCAVDVGLYDVHTGLPIEMPSGYDEFTDRAAAFYPGGNARAKFYRDVLRTAMERQGFHVYPGEWWHFDFEGWEKYPIENKPLE